MNENYGMTVAEAEVKICPVLPGLGWYIAVGGGEIARSTSVNVSSVGPSHCHGSGCAMWTWVNGSSERGYCGLRGHVVIP